MSLRDQLLKAGIVNQKKVRQANRQLKKKRKVEQGQRQSRRQVERTAQAEEATRRAAQEEKGAAERARRREIREREETRRAVQMWLRTHRIPLRNGNQLFFHRSARGPRIVRCEFPESVVWELVRGRMAIAWDGPSSADPEYILIPDRTAQRLQELAPERVLFFNAEPTSEDDPAEQPYDMGEIRAARERVPDRWQGLR